MVPIWLMSRKRMIRSLTAVSLIVVSFIQFGAYRGTVLAKERRQSSHDRSAILTTQDMRPERNPKISSASATPVAGGVLLQWNTEGEADDRRFGFNVYRMRNGFLTVGTRIDASGSFSQTRVALPHGQAYQWFDPEGTADTVYYVSSITATTGGRVTDIVVPVLRGGEAQAGASLTQSAARNGAAAQFVYQYPASSADYQSSNASLPGQWDIASKPALKIQVRTDGWYRVTQQQMAAAGFNTAVDIKNLSLFLDGTEIAIRTNKDNGQLESSDFIEFYGQGLDTLETDTRIYYLLAGSTPGKRARGELKAEDAGRIAQIAKAAPLPADNFTYKGWFAPLIAFLTGETSPGVAAQKRPAPDVSASVEARGALSEEQASTVFALEPKRHLPISTKTENVKKTESENTAAESATPKAVSAPKTRSKRKYGKKGHRRRSRRTLKPSRAHRNHASAQAAAPALSFNDTIEIRERFNFNTQLPVGHNFIGTAMSNFGSVTKTLTLNNIQSSADGPARLEIALQGFSFTSHQVNVQFNNVMIGTMTFFSRDRLVQIFNIPVSQLVEGTNTVKFTPVGVSDSEFFDSLKLTYPHKYRAASDSLRFSLKSTQALTVDGFSTANIRLIDTTDPTSIKITRPIVANSASGYTISVPAGPRAKSGRTMYALPEGQFQTPAGFSLNQPSTLNAASNQADLLIISHRDFMPSVAPLVALRQSQGLTVQTADVEDVYDEFSFGAHGAKALKDFLAYINTPGSWAKAPKYVLLVGDASYDPREYFSTAVTRSRVRRHDNQHLGCADAGDNGSDYEMALFGLPRNSAFAASPCNDASGLVISELYDGGGDRANAYANGYIELFNRGPAAISVDGWSVQYAAANASAWQVTSLTNVTIQPGHYYLVQEAGLGGFYPLVPTPDAIGNISISRTGGKVALVNNTTPLSGPCPTGGAIVDFLGYGSAANCFQGNGPARVTNDFVPTVQIDTLFGIACSDDALADPDNDGIPAIAVGRLPVTTPTEANLIVSKIVNFSKVNVPQNAMLVADSQLNCANPPQQYYYNFVQANQEISNLLSPGLTAQAVNRGENWTSTSDAALRTTIINNFNQGVALVHYSGHGNLTAWSCGSFFSAADAYGLTNGNRLPLVVVADCLNGLFDDPVLDGIAESLIKAPNGGAVATFASSGDTIPDGQQEMNLRLYQLLFGGPSMALGDVTRQAKSSTTDLDVRRTWILLGDPSMKIW